MDQYYNKTQKEEGDVEDKDHDDSKKRKKIYAGKNKYMVRRSAEL